MLWECVSGEPGLVWVVGGCLCWERAMEIKLVRQRVGKGNVSGKAKRGANALGREETYASKKQIPWEIGKRKIREARPYRPWRPFKIFGLILWLTETHLRALWEAVTWFWHVIINHFTSSSYHTAPCMVHTGQSSCAEKRKSSPSLTSEKLSTVCRVKSLGFSCHPGA